MEALTVSRAGRESFLAQAIAFGAEHNVLPDGRRRALAHEAVGLHQMLTTRFGRNPFDIGEALKVADIFECLVAVGVERTCGRDLLKAATSLRDLPLREQVIPILTGIEQGVARVVRVLARSVFTGHTKFDYDVEVWKVRMRDTNEEGAVGRTAIMPAVNALTVVEWLDPRKTPSLCMQVGERITTLHDYEAWMREVETLEKEERISNAHLPWAQLEEDAGLQRVRMREFSGDVFQGVWTPTTLISTLTASLVCGGAMRLFPDAVFAKDLLRHFKLVIKYPDGFKKRGRVKFGEYLVQHLKIQDAAVRAHLMEFWEEAMEMFLAPLPRRSLASLPVGTWAERMHLGVSVRTLAQSYLGKDAGVVWAERPKRKTIAEKIRALGDEPKPASLSGILRRFKADDLKGEDVADELIMLVPPQYLIRYWPLTVEAVSELISRWRLPRSRFADADRRAFITHLFKEAPAAFWQDMTDDLYDRLSAVDPAQEQALWFERERWQSRKKK